MHETKTWKEDSIYKAPKIFETLSPTWGIGEAFDGTHENESASKPLAEHDVYDRVKYIVTIFGKTQKIDAYMCGNVAIK